MLYPKVLVLGSSGQIGSFLTKYLKLYGHQVVEWDIIKDGIACPEQDLRIDNPKLTETMAECDFVIYLASDVGGSAYLKNYQHTFAFINNNMLIMSNVFKALITTNKPFIFASSQMSELCFSTYGQLKSLAEKIVKNTHGMFVRMWNVYGNETCSEKFHVVTDFLNMARTQGEIRTRTDGMERRQFLYVEDCSEAFRLLMESYPNIDKAKNYHITSFRWTSIQEIANLISRIVPCKVVFGTEKDTVQMKQMNEPDSYILTMWTPKIGLAEGIQRIYEQM